jgi:hypothetical protein
MKTSATDRAIAKLEAKKQVIDMAIAELRNVADQEPEAASTEKKTRKPRRPRGLSDTMPASAANHRQARAEQL